MLVASIKDKYKFQDKYNTLLNIISETNALRFHRKYNDDLYQTLEWFEKHYKKYILYYCIEHKDYITNFLNDKDAVMNFLHNFYEWFSNRWLRSLSRKKINKKQKKYLTK